MFLKIFETLASMLIMMSFGFFFRKRKLLNDELLTGLSYLLLNLTLPCLVIVVMQIDFSAELAKEAFLALGIFFVVIVAGTSIGMLVAKLLRLEVEAARVYSFAMGFSNITYMGYPIVSMLYGDPGCFYISVAGIIFNLMNVTYGMRILSGKGSGKFPVKKLFSPASVASIFGFVLFLLSIKLWNPLAVALRSVGNMTSPISMIFIGATLANAKPKEIFLDVRLYIYSAVKLLVIPVAGFFVLKVFITNELMLMVITLMLGMPAAAITAILTKNCNGDTVTASKVVFISTALSCLTLPLLMFLA